MVNSTEDEVQGAFPLLVGLDPVQGVF